MKPTTAVFAIALLAAACSSASGQTTTPTGPNKCERPEVSAVVDADTLAVSLVWEVRPEIESLAISPAPASPVTASAGSVAVDVPVGGEGSWHVRARCLIGGDPWQSSHAVVSLAAQNWIAALAARPVGLPEPGGFCFSDPRPDQQPQVFEYAWNDHASREGWRTWASYHRWEIECPGWDEPLVVLGRARSSAGVFDCRQPGGLRWHTLPGGWAAWSPHPEWSTWADRHPDGLAWCWDGRQNRIIFEVDGSTYRRHDHPNHGHPETPPTRSILPD